MGNQVYCIMSSYKYVVLLFVVISIFSATKAQAVEQISQVVSLAEGWNIISTPMVLESHEFSVPETSENFDIYLLDSSQPTGWTTMATIGQTEFTPLFGYFINNKTGSPQTLTLNYDTTLAPNEKLFERTFIEDGWYSIGIANDEYAKDQSADKVDTDNPSKILSLMTGQYDLVVDFTNADYDINRRSVAVSDPWKMVVPSDIDSVNDFRETKGYAVYIKEGGVKYIGAQNDPQIGDVTDQEDELIVVDSVNNPDPTTLLVEDDATSSWYTIFAFGLDSGESDDDITISSIPIQLSLSKSTYAEVIYDVELVVGGVTYNDFAVSDIDSNNPVLTFNLDIGATLYSGERIEAELIVRFKPLLSENQGIRIKAEVNNPDAIVANVGELLLAHQLNGTAIGSEQKLYSEGLVLEITSIHEEEVVVHVGDVGDIDRGTYTFEFEVTALGNDFFIDEDVDVVNYRFMVDGVAAPAGSSTATLDILGADDAANADYMINEGETVTFAFTIESGAGVSGSVKTILDSVDYSAADDATEELNVLATPTDDWTSSSLILN
ncbi:MAG: hypothetical protein KBC35_03220 [Candidatus Pacebacteria bacterium]|nr:hypothetical protein [Candidatus Paceibacterota bacterium]